MGDREGDILECIVEGVQDELKVRTGEKAKCAYIILRINHDRELMPENGIEKKQRGRKAKNLVVVVADSVESEELKIKKSCCNLQCLAK